MVSPALPQARFGYINVECIMFQREDPAFVRRVFLQLQARCRSVAAGGASITHRIGPARRGTQRAAQVLHAG